MNSYFSFLSRSAAFVRISSRTAAAALLLLLVGLPGALRGAEEDFQADLDAITSMWEAEIEMANKPLTELQTKYNLALQKQQEEAQAGGDLKGVLAAMKVIEHHASGVLFSPLSEDLKIAKIQQAYQKAYEDMQKQVATRRVAMDRDYVNQLEKLIKELTQAGSIEDAVKISKIRDQFIENYKAAKAANTIVPVKPLAAPPPKSEWIRAGEERDFEIAPGVRMKMCWIPPGDFEMGSAKDELGHKGGETQHKVTLTKGFWLGKYEVTQEEWQAVMGNNPSQLKGMDHPVDKVSWNDISNPGGFLQKVNKNAGSGGSFLLPTEAQWEYACRAGTTTSLNSGKDITTIQGNCRNLEKIAWYNENSDGKTHPVGQKKANAWRLHDMHGNVLEWCSDWSGTYPAGPSTDPEGVETGTYRVLRGGSWFYGAGYCRAADCGNDYLPGGTISGIGFRLAHSSVP